MRCALPGLGARRGILAWIRLVGVARICGINGEARPCVWHARMSVGGANVRLRPEIGRGILLRQAGRPPYDRRVKIKLSVSVAPELDHAVREVAGRACRCLHG